MQLAGGLGAVLPRILGAWIAVSLAAGGVAAVRHDPSDEVATAGGSVESVAGPFDTEDPRLRPPLTTSTTAASTTTTTVAAPPPAGGGGAPAPRTALTIDRPGTWIIRADGSEARFVSNDLGQGAPRGYGALWSPDSSSFLSLMSRDGEHLQLVRTALDGSRRWYDLPPSPPIGDEVGPAPRWMTDLSVSGDRIVFGWRRDDGFAGAAVATLDLSRVLVEFDDDHYCCLASGNATGTRFAFSTGAGIEVLDLSGRRVAGPFDLGAPGSDVSRGAGPWSPDGKHLLAGVEGRACVLDLTSGSCPTVSFGNHPSISWLGGGHALLMELFGNGSTPTSLHVRRPGEAPRRLTADGSYGVSHPNGSAVAFGRSPYEDGLPGRASVHVIGSDGRGEQLLAHTRNAVAFPWGWSPDGRWIAVHLGGPR